MLGGVNKVREYRRQDAIIVSAFLHVPVAGYPAMNVRGAMGLLARTGAPVTTPTPTPEQGERPPLPPPDPPPKQIEPYKPEEQNIFLEKPAFLPPKPIPHSPKISPSSIPNPSPSVSTTKMEPGYPNYGGYLYSIPGYSAFQPISYPGMMQPNQAPIQNDTQNSDFVPFQSMKDTEDKSVEMKSSDNQKVETPKTQTDFEEQFTPEVVPAVSNADVKNSNDNKMNITSLSQGSGATVTMPTQLTKDANKKKNPERFSLKTSIPISKIDMKCVGTNPPEPVFQNAMTKKPQTFNPAFQNTKVDLGSKVEIQSNIIIKSALKDPEVKAEAKQPSPSPNNINTLINAAEAINKTDNQFRKPEPKVEVINEIKDPPPFTPPIPTPRPMFSPMNIETNKVNFPNKAPEGNFSEQKNQILFIQNKNPSNSKMLLTIQQQNPQVLLQRTNFDSKNLQAPSRLSNQKKCKEDLLENGTSSKVVALKRLHQENCDENDFENLITENQIYGNKIVVKEKSQGTQQEQDLKNKNKTIEKPTQPETKNVVLQPNFLYLSNVQFPANLMMIKNNTKVSQPTEPKLNKITANENKITTEVSTMTNNNDIKTTKAQNIAVSKEIHVLKSSNNVLQTFSSKNNKTDVVFQTPHQKVIMNPIVYQVPMIMDTDNKLNQPFINREYPKFIGQNKKEYPKSFEQKSNDKLFIACPYQMDSKLQPKIVITNIRPKITKVEEISSLDIYEKRKRLRRLKYLSNRDLKESPKIDMKKVNEKIENYNNVITPDKMKAEICKEFATTKLTIDEGSSESDTDYGEDDLDEYNSIIDEFCAPVENDNGKVAFLANFRLASHDDYKEKELVRQERMLRGDSVASAYIAAGRLDRLTKEENVPENPVKQEDVKEEKIEVMEKENGVALQKKQLFLSHLRLTQVSTQYKEGYERTWKEIIKERKRRNGISEPRQILKQPKVEPENLDFDTNGQLQILTEIKKCVNENNNLIKKRLDSSENDEGDSIRILAEKNFSELNRLSKMADRSVKLITGQDTRKRDLNPGFDSENIQKHPKIEQSYQHINIPNISKIISLKTQETVSTQVTSQATSMDEPMNSAAGVKEMFQDLNEEKRKEVGCQAEESTWPGIEAVMKSYKEFDAARKKQQADLHRRNTALRVEGAYITRSASRESDRARALLAERQHLAMEENSVRTSLQRLCTAIEAVRTLKQ